MGFRHPNRHHQLNVVYMCMHYGSDAFELAYITAATLHECISGNTTELNLKKKYKYETSKTSEIYVSYKSASIPSDVLRHKFCGPLFCVFGAQQKQVTSRYIT